MPKATVAVPIALVAGFAVTVGVMQTQILGAGSDQNEIEVAQVELQEAVRNIGKQQIKHISEIRYQDCYKRCIEPKGCPEPPAPLPKSRCKGNGMTGHAGESR